jgi:hypothetical protein
MFVRLAVEQVKNPLEPWVFFYPECFPSLLPDVVLSGKGCGCPTASAVRRDIGDWEMRKYQQVKIRW